MLSPRQDKIESSYVRSNALERGNATGFGKCAGFEVDAQSVEKPRRNLLREVVTDQSKLAEFIDSKSVEDPVADAVDKPKT